MRLFRLAALVLVLVGCESDSKEVARASTSQLVPVQEPVDQAARPAERGSNRAVHFPTGDRPSEPDAEGRPADSFFETLDMLRMLKDSRRSSPPIPIRWRLMWLGLRDTDRVLRVNGIPFPFPRAESAGLEAAARRAGFLSLTAERDGQTIELRHAMTKGPAQFDPLRHDSELFLDRLTEAASKPELSPCGRRLEGIGSWTLAYRLGLRDGDELLNVNSEQCPLSEATVARARAEAYRLRYLLLSVRRDGRFTYLRHSLPTRAPAVHSGRER